MKSAIIYRFCSRNGLCTIDCPQRGDCGISRQKILLHAVVVNLKKGDVIKEDYMNEIVYLKRNIKIDLNKLEDE